jgi:hypothetical protein
MSATLNDARQLRDLLEKAVKVKQRRDDQMLALEAQLARQEANARDIQAKQQQQEQRHAESLQSFLAVVKSLQTAQDDLHENLLQLVDENEKLRRKSSHDDSTTTTTTASTSGATTTTNATSPTSPTAAASGNGVAGSGGEPLSSPSSAAAASSKPPKLKTRSLTSEFTPPSVLKETSTSSLKTTSTSNMMAPPPLPDM